MKKLRDIVEAMSKTNLTAPKAINHAERNLERDTSFSAHDRPDFPKTYQDHKGKTYKGDPVEDEDPVPLSKNAIDAIERRRDALKADPGKREGLTSPPVLKRDETILTPGKDGYKREKLYDFEYHESPKAKRT